MTIAGVVAARPGRPRALLALLPFVAAAGGCTAMIVDMVLDSETTASVTVSGDEERLVQMVADLGLLADVRTIVRSVRFGGRVVEIVGTYAALVETLRWIATLGLELAANDQVTGAILEAALLLLK